MYNYNYPKHSKGVFGRWWLVVGFLWTLLSNADLLVSKYTSAQFQASWAAEWYSPKWGWQVWIIGILVITVVFEFFHSYRKIKEPSDKLDQIEAARPLLRVAANGFHHDIRELKALDASTGRMTRILAHLSCVHVRFKNDPKVATDTSVARDVLAEISFYDESSRDLLCSLQGRWGDTLEPPLLRDGTPEEKLATVNFAIGQERELNIAFKYQREPECYGMSNDSYKVSGWKHDKYKLSCSKIRAHVRLRSSNGVDSSWDLWFDNPSTGELQAIKQQEVLPVAP